MKGFSQLKHIKKLPIHSIISTFIEYKKSEIFTEKKYN